MSKEKFTFQAEVSKLLEIVAGSLYSHKEIFLRELASNASDACDKLRYAALTRPELLDGGADLGIELSIDKKKRTLTISDNGIGMNHDDLVDMLGTIARSGTQAFIEQIKAGAEYDKKSKDGMALIGKFGVGFYSSFMVADTVEVLTRKAGEDKAWLWTSDGKGEFTIDAAERKTRGATVTLHMKKGEDEFLEEIRLQTIIKTHSDHIPVPIVLKGKEGDKTLNTASALWMRAKSDISEDQYKEFYHHVGHTFDDPWLTIHNAVEGVVSYANLLFIPSTRPFDLFQSDRKQHVKLYVKRVFITDDCQGLLPSYFRFLRGVVDSEDLTLNISREMLQHDPKLAKIRSGLIKRILGELKKKAEKKPDEYAEFWDNFGGVFKEGIYDDFENRDRIMELSRFHSTNGDGPVSLEDYAGRIKEGQDSIFYITGDDLEQLKQSPQLEGFRDRGVEVLLLTDPVDEFWISAAVKYKEKAFKSATRGGADLSKIAGKKADGDKADKDEDKTAKKNTPDMDKLIAAFKSALGESVKDVRVSERLTDSPVCLVAAEGDMDMHLERMLKQHQQLGAGVTSRRILEVNPGHPLIGKLAELAGAGDSSSLSDAAHLLLDQARIVEGETVPDAAAFSKRLAKVLEKGLM